MKKLFYVFSLALSLFVVSPSFALDVQKLNQQAISATVQLNKNCSATVIYSDRNKETGDVKTVVLTAKHCVDDIQNKTSDIDVPVYNSKMQITEVKSYKSESTGIWYKGDLAILELKNKDTLFKNVAKLSSSDVNIPIGSTVYTVGYPLGKTLTVTHGMFSSVEEIAFPDAKKDTAYYRASPGIAGGNSGGGLYLETKDGNYELIGVTSAKVQGTDFVGYYVPIYMIEEYLKIAVPELYTPKK